MRTDAAADEAIVYVIDDDPSVRDAIADLLLSVGVEARVFAAAQQFLASARPDVPGCLVLDVRLPGLSGLEVQRVLLSSGIELPIIFLTGYADVPMSVDAMKSGAVEFLTKPFREQVLLEAIQHATDKDRARRRENAGLADLRRRFAELTPREQEVMAEVVIGQLNKQIASRLGLAEVTVKIHRGRVMQKMHAKSVVDLARMADSLAAADGRAHRGGDHTLG